MSEFIMYVGLPGSGKTTEALDDRALYKKGGANVVYLSSDRTRKNLYGGEEEQREPYKVFELMLQYARKALKEENVIILYDATNLSSKRRMNLLKQLRQSCPELYCKVKVVLASLQTCIYRNFKRERIVPFSAIMKMLKSFQCPHFFEGWDAIELIYTDEFDIMEPYDLIAAARDFDQSCPSHRENLLEHTLQTFDYFDEHFASTFDKHESELLGWALLYHDFGKLYTQVDRNKKGEKTYFKRDGEYLPNMHYYGHDCASAYLWLVSSVAFDLLKDRQMKVGEILEIANIIQYHMEKIKRDEKGYVKLMKRLPAPLVSRIEIVNICDKNGRILVEDLY